MHLPSRTITAAILAILTAWAGAKESPPTPWDFAALFPPPKSTPSPDHNVGDVKAVFLDEVLPRP